jgi:hypothetical protein
VQREGSCFTRARHLSVPWASSIQSTPSRIFLEELFWYYPPIYAWVFKVIFSSGFTTTTLYGPLLSTIRAITSRKLVLIPTISFFYTCLGLRSINMEYRYSSTLSLTSALDGVGDERHSPAALPLGKRPVTHFAGDWVSPGPVWTGREHFPHEELKSLTTFGEKIGLEVKETNIC